jgi:hypothetical protein
VAGLRTDHTIVADFTVTFEVRVAAPDAEGFFGLLGVDGKDRRTEVMVALPIASAAAAPRRSSISVVRVAISTAPRARVMKPVGEWNADTVTRNSTGVHVLLSGLTPLRLHTRISPSSLQLNRRDDSIDALSHDGGRLRVTWDK